jgi:hypothetical protein
MVFVAAAKAGGVDKDPTSAKVYDGLYSFNKETTGGLTVPLTYTKGQQTHIECWFYLGIKNQKFVEPQGLKPACVPAGTKLPG